MTVRFYDVGQGLAALVTLEQTELVEPVVHDTVGALLKYQDDIAKIEGAKAAELVQAVRAELRAGER